MKRIQAFFVFRLIASTLFVLVVAMGFFSQASTAAKTISAKGEYTMSDYETPEFAEERAFDYACQSAMEQIGVHVASYTRTKGLDALMATLSRESSKRTSTALDAFRRLKLSGRWTLRHRITLGPTRRSLKALRTRRGKTSSAVHIFRTPAPGIFSTATESASASAPSRTTSQRRMTLP